MTPSSDGSGSDRSAGRDAGRRRRRPRRSQSDDRQGNSTQRKDGSAQRKDSSAQRKDSSANKGGGRGREPRPGADAASTPGRRRKGRRGRGRRPDTKGADSATAVLARKPETLDTNKDVEEPLGPAEVAALRKHFRFLREHRKELRLKVNAAEDLLLNGAREPTHRGVCQHLLRKVDRSSVLRAAERLEPPAAAALLAGIIGFAPEIEYVLLLLDKIRLSSPPQQARAALAQALEQIDFEQVSSAQMRRVLGLIAELFPERDLPDLLLGLLESRSFLEAFDSSLEGLPEPLRRLVAPLRAVQGVVLHGKPNTYDPETLGAGIERLLAGDEASLHRRPPEVRRRLLLRGLEACGPPDHPHHRSLEALLASFSKDDRQQLENGLALARHLLAAALDDDAGRVLKSLAAAHPEADVPGRWSKLLGEHRRFDRFVADAGQNEARDVLGHHRRVAGYWLDSMRPVWIQIETPEHSASHSVAAELLDGLVLPGAVPLLGSGVTPEGAHYFVTPRPGRGLDRLLRHKRGPSLTTALSLCLDGATLFAALGGVGIRLSDAAPRRFETDAQGRLWLVDVAGAERSSKDEATAASLEAARLFCEAVLGSSRRHLVPADLLEALHSARTAAELVRHLARSPLAPPEAPETRPPRPKK